jgi:hypothetical protein
MPFLHPKPWRYMDTLLLNKHPNSNVDSPEAQDAWTKLTRMMDTHRRMLIHVYLEQNETTRQTYLSTEYEGTEIESRAISCESLSVCICPVSRKIETGSFESILEESDEDDTFSFHSQGNKPKSVG